MRKTLLAALVLTLFAAAFLPLAAGAQSVSEAEAPDTGSLTVVGNGKATAKPDRASVTAVASTKAPTLTAAAAGHKDLTSRVGTLLQSLKDKGLELASSNSSLGEDPYYGSQRETRPHSFTASTTYDLNVADLDRLDALIAELTASGLLEVRTVSFSVRDNRPAWTKRVGMLCAMGAVRRRFWPRPPTPSLATSLTYQTCARPPRYRTGRPTWRRPPDIGSSSPRSISISPPR